MTTSAKRVVVLGGGFAGVEAAISLRRDGFDVTLVSDRDYIYICPISIWIPTREIEFEDACLPLARLKEAHGFELVVDPVRGLDLEGRRVELSNGELSYDWLVLAVGAARMKPEGVEHTLSICGNTTGVLAFRERLDALLAAGSGRIAFGFGGNPRDSSAVRGGPVFEMILNVHTLLRRKKLRKSFELTFFAPMPEPGKRMGPKALEMMDRMFRRSGIEKKVGTPITGFDERGVLFDDGQRIDTDLTIFVPGSAGHPLVQGKELPLNKAGFVRIEESCRVRGFEEVFAVGDVAAIEGPRWRAKQGHMAEVMARIAAAHIAAAARGGDCDQRYGDHHGILCMLDTGDGAAYVKRDDKGARTVPMPIVGHWLKRGWGRYWKLSRLGRIPRLPGM